MDTPLVFSDLTVYEAAPREREKAVWSLKLWEALEF